MGVYLVYLVIGSEPQYNHTVFNESDLTEYDVNLLCEKQFGIAKVLDTKMPYTVSDIRKSFEHSERDAEDNIEPYADDNFEYSVRCVEDGLYFYMNEPYTSEQVSKDKTLRKTISQGLI